MAATAAGGDEDAMEEVREGYEGNALWRVFREYGRAEWPQFAAGATASVLSRSMELVPAFVLGVAVDAVFFDTRDYVLPLVPDGWIPGSAEEQLFLTVGLIAAAYFVGATTGWANSWAWNHFSQHLQHALRVDTYDVLQGRELAFFDDKQTGEMMSVLNNDVNQLEDFLTSRLNSLIRIVVRVGGMGLVMVLLYWQLALIPVVVIPLLAAASYWFVSVIHPKYRDVRSSVGALNSRLENNLGGIEVIKAYDREGFERERVEGASRDYLDAQWDAITTRVKFFPSLRVITSSGFAATLLVGGLWVLNGPPAFAAERLTAGTLVTFLLYTRRFVYPMRQFGQILNEYQYAQAAAERVVGLLDADAGVPERPDAVELEDVEGRVEYEDVSFAYEAPRASDRSSGERSDPRDDEIVLEDVSFEVEPGELVGVVGPTGAGKTTLLKLLLRFYDASEGTVRLDGHDVRDVTLDSLRGAISYVSQEPFLFYGTVRENVAYGLTDPRNENADDPIDDAAVREAARLAGAHEFVADLPDGYDTMVGERGVKLSGGQRQRISIARAVLRDPAVLVLDEATSHVDNETEVLIQEQLDSLVADRTTFAIAHRLSTVRDADRILVLDDGRLVEEGSHEELLAHDGLYADLWSVQVGEVDELPDSFVERAVDRERLLGGDD